MKTFAISVAIILLCGGTGWTAEPCHAPATCTEAQTHGAADCCAQCGCAGPCEKYCRVVCEMKEVKKTVWSVKCEEFCAPLPRCGLCDCDGGANCDCGCSEKCDPCAAENARKYVTPKCGKVREKKTLVKKEVVCKVPSYKCVVVYRCSQCGAAEGGAAKPTSEAAPTPPAPKPGKAA